MRTGFYTIETFLVKWSSVHLRTKWLWVRVQLQSLKLQISLLLRARSSLTFRQLQSVDGMICEIYIRSVGHRLSNSLNVGQSFFLSFLFCFSA